jgi:hypothetical protein
MATFICINHTMIREGVVAGALQTACTAAGPDVANRCADRATNMRIDCVMGAYGRYSLACEALASTISTPCPAALRSPEGPLWP